MKPKPDFKEGDKVSYGQVGGHFVVAEVKRFPHGWMVGIYDEPPSKHVDWLRPESVSKIPYET